MQHKDEHDGVLGKHTTITNAILHSSTTVEVLSTRVLNGWIKHPEKKVFIIAGKTNG